MTVPEENRPKTDTTDEVIRKPAEEQAGKARPGNGASGRTLREALEEAGIEREDFEDR
ncbi:hypothetical protein [Streptomyces sp. TP-A0356]|uniref:hypothetical protein n=1 Tax=Streptomyces sp. TP-A0356 TaxID=1359208 RepID=UPI000AE68662|nr:hypothetical protein [Streptomyces sp. TP-A0356]